MPSEEYADGVDRPAEFVPAAQLYDAQCRERVAWDWAKMQPVAESQAEVERAVAGVLDVAPSDAP